MNDLVPYFAKDLHGCMRWTAYFSMEMKLFLALPVVCYLYHLGHRTACIAFCAAAVLGGLGIYGWCLYVYRIHPGYLSLYDYQTFDLIHLKPWNHIDSYFLGVLIAFAYQRIKNFRFGLSDLDTHESRFLRLVVQGSASPALLLIGSQVLYVICGYLHAHMDWTRSGESGKNESVIWIDPNGFAFNAVIMTVAKVLALISLVMQVTVIITGRLLGFRSFL